MKFRRSKKVYCLMIKRNWYTVQNDYIYYSRNNVNMYITPQNTFFIFTSDQIQLYCTTFSVTQFIYIYTKPYAHLGRCFGGSLGISSPKIFGLKNFK